MFGGCLLRPSEGPWLGVWGHFISHPPTYHRSPRSGRPLLPVTPTSHTLWYTRGRSAFSSQIMNIDDTLSIRLIFPFHTKMQYHQSNFPFTFGCCMQLAAPSGPQRNDPLGAGSHVSRQSGEMNSLSLLIISPPSPQYV